MTDLYLNAAQLKAESEKCLQCPTKPCLKACPVSCSPHDFIAAAKQQKWEQAADLILRQNPLGETCGLICPEKFCMQACLRAKIDYPIRIPAVQASILQKARENGKIASKVGEVNGKKVAVIGLGPAGIGAVSELLKYGYEVTAYEKNDIVGGALNLIPQRRLPREVINFEWQRLKKNPLLTACFNTLCTDYEQLARQYDAIIICGGEQKVRMLGVDGEKYAVDYTKYLQNPTEYVTNGSVAIIGGGAVAVDCAVTAALNGANSVEMFVRRRLSDMRITPNERASLLQNNINISALTRIKKIAKNEDMLDLSTCKTKFDTEGKLVDVLYSDLLRRDFALVILALGSTNSEDLPQGDNIFYAGDMINGGSTAVQAIASGKNAVQQVQKYFGF